MSEYGLRGIGRKIMRISFLFSALCLLFFVSAYAALGVSVTGGNWAIGDIGMEAVKETTGNTWTVTNEGSIQETIYIKVEGADGANPWSPGSDSGLDTFILKHNALGSWSDAVTSTGEGIKLKSLPSAGTANFDLQLTGPTSTTDTGQRMMTVTLTAMALALDNNEVLVLNDNLMAIGTASGYLIWPRLQSCVATNNNGGKLWKISNTYGQPTWSDVTHSYTYPAEETAGHYPAFGWAEGVNYEGYTDWHLPTRDELEQLYIYGRAYISYTSGYYWTSIESGETFALMVGFGNGVVGNGSKPFGYYVRAVRLGE